MTFGLILRSGAPRPVGGIRRAAPQQASANTIIMHGERCRIAAILGGEAADDGAGEDGDECRAFDQRVAGGKFVRSSDDRAGCRT